RPGKMVSDTIFPPLLASEHRSPPPRAQMRRRRAAQPCEEVAPGREHLRLDAERLGARLDLRLQRLQRVPIGALAGACPVDLGEMLARSARVERGDDLVAVTDRKSG